MNEEYRKALKGLGKGQLEAVQKIYGPVLVIAGPGTGKTQLIGTRAGYILENTDARASDILCLTFTTAGVSQMRERLIRLIGQEAYNVNIFTYHAFGGEVLRRNPEYFDDEQLEPLEDLRQDILLRDIISKLPHDNQLKYADGYIKDIAGFIQDAKQALLTPEDIKAVAESNLAAIEAFNRDATAILSHLDRVTKQSGAIFLKLLPVLTKKSPKTTPPRGIAPLLDTAAAELEAAIEAFNLSTKTTPLSEWKRHWLEKDSEGRFILSGKRQNDRLAAAGVIFANYQAALAEKKLYDFDDMILRAIKALEANPELRYSLAEQFQFIMLDEFQDTNQAQFRLVELLTDHPSLEGEPNILAVGDDDQAIYAFQGADQANMARFAKTYKNVKVISLAENYRATPELVEVAHNIAGQIQQRLHHNFPGLEKVLTAVNKDLPPAHLAMREFKSDAAEYAWVTGEIKRLIDRGKIPARDIAVLAPKHKFLENMLPFLAAAKLPVHYEKRENILDAPVIRQLTQMGRLILALDDGNEALADELWPEVLSYDFWQLPTDALWRLSWAARNEHKPWTEQVLATKQTRQIGNFFLQLKALARLQPLELILDGLIGMPDASQSLGLKFISPLYEQAFGLRAAQAKPQEFVELITDLSILRGELRDWSHSETGPLDLRSFVEFVDGHRAAGLNILNQSPYHQAENAVNLLTAYSAKGREFRAVFVIGATDDIWGSASRSQSQRLSLPPNLSFIRYQGASEDERLRLLFVAATRARTHLYFTSCTQTLAGKATPRLKYLDIGGPEDEPRVGVLPAKFAAVVSDESDAITPETASYYWQKRHLPPFKTPLKALLAPQLARYQLSATDLNRFIDLERAGPEAFFLKSILGFPEAPTQTAIYGTAVHDTLKWLGGRLKTAGKLPTEKQTLDYFERLLAGRRLPPDQFSQLLDKGNASLRLWLKSRGRQLGAKDVYEYNFREEGVFVGKAHLGGKIDRLIIDDKRRTVEVIDYKTGQPFAKWSSELKHHKFRQQLMFYKLLVEDSERFRGYTVERGFIEFVEPQDGRIVPPLELKYDDKELETFKQLIAAIWRDLQKLDFPPVDKYPSTLSGVRRFEADLIAK